MTETCDWCQEDVQEPEEVGFVVTAESGPDGEPLYRCAACEPKALQGVPETPVVFSQELVEALTFSWGADVLRQATGAVWGDQ